LSTFGDEMRALAVELVEQDFPCSATWIVGPDSSSYDAATGKATALGTTFSITCSPPQPFDIAMVDGSTILAGDLSVILPADGLAFTPKVGDSITVGGDTMQVVALGREQPDELPAAWVVACRK